MEVQKQCFYSIFKQQKSIMRIKNLQGKEMNNSENNISNIGEQFVKACNEYEESEGNGKSSMKLPPLKKNKLQDKETEKLCEIIPPPNLQRACTSEEQKKSLANSQTCVVRKFHSKKKIQKKKTINNGFKPQLINKYNMYKDFQKYVNLSNNLSVKQNYFEPYVFYVGRGNNGSLIKNIFRNYRPWWVLEEDPSNQKINLHWYQLRQNHILDRLKDALRPEAQNENHEYFLDGINKKIEENRSCSRQEKRIHSSVRSQSLIRDQHQQTKINKNDCIVNKKNSSKSRMMRSSEKVSKISPLIKKYTVKELKEEGLESETQIMPSMKKPLTNPRMWPIYYNYRKLFCATDMKKIKQLNVIKQDGKIHGNLCRSKIKAVEGCSFCMHNHLQNNWNLSNKKALFMNMKSYFQARNINPFDYIPMTFHVEKVGDKEFENFLEEYHRRNEVINEQNNNSKKSQYKSAFKPKKRNAWLIKPGQNTNRGIGIEVAESLEEIRDIISKDETDNLGRPRTHIIQEYIMPFLYQKRKFDIRSYILITSVNGYQKGYWYQDGYIRTTSKEFNMKNLSNRAVHLTNDSVQKKCEDYGKYQPGNKLSFADFQRYLDATYNGGDGNTKLKFWQQAYPQMKKLANDAIRGVYTKMNPHKKEFCFEIFGLDFIIDESFKVWLIEANTNPCLEVSAPLLGRLIPSLIENVLRIAVDPIFPPPPLDQIAKMTKKVLLPENAIQNNKFQLIFDELEDGKQLRDIITEAPELKIYEIQEEEDEYEEDYERVDCQPKE